MNEIEIGGQLVPQQSFEAIAQISSNKTLFVERLTSKPAKPEIIKGLKTLDEVFQHFKPTAEVEFETADGAPVKENLSFHNLADFGKQGLIDQSEFLKGLQLEQETFQNIYKQLNSNKILRSALSDPDARASYINALKMLISEMESAQE